jgi:hypothetical protein
MSEKTVFIEIFENGKSVYKERITEPLSDDIPPYTFCLMITGLLLSINKKEK